MKTANEGQKLKDAFEKIYPIAEKDFSKPSKEVQEYLDASGITFEEVQRTLVEHGIIATYELLGIKPL